MEKQFEIIRKTREMLLSILEGLPAERLNKVPEGFNNNIVWNAGHIVAAQQGICYRRAGLPLVIEGTMFEKYKPDSKPQGEASEEEVAQIKELLFSTIDDLQRDYESGKFANYTPWVTRYGVDVKNIEDAITFLSFHDGLHIGYTMALKRCLNAVQPVGQPVL